MRQVLALVTLSHVTMPSSLSVRASSYLVSLPHSALHQHARYFTRFWFSRRQETLLCQRFCRTVVMETHQTEQNKSWLFQKKKKKKVEKKLIWTHYFSRRKHWKHQECPLKCEPAVTKGIKKWVHVNSPCSWLQGKSFTQLSADSHSWLGGSPGTEATGLIVWLRLDSAGCWVLWMDADQWKHYTHTLFEDWGGGVCKDPKTVDHQWGMRLNQSGLIYLPWIHSAWLYTSPRILCLNNMMLLFNEVYWSSDCFIKVKLLHCIAMFSLELLITLWFCVILNNNFTVCCDLSNSQQEHCV